MSVALPASGVTPQRQADGTCRFAGNGIQQAARAGEPDMPVQVVTVLLPPDADLTTVKAAIPGYGWTAIEGEWVVPPASPLAAGDCGASGLSPADGTPADGRDPGIYQESALYPSDPVRKVDVQVMRGWKMAQILYAPFAYNPVEKQIYRLSGSSIEVTFERTSAGADSSGVDLTAADIVREAAVNYSAVAAEYGDTAISTDAGRYVIITTTAIEEESGSLMDFVASKEARGFTVQVVTEDTWGGGTGNAAANNHPFVAEEQLPDAGHRVRAPHRQPRPLQRGCPHEDVLSAGGRPGLPGVPHRLLLRRAHVQLECRR